VERTVAGPRLKVDRLDILAQVVNSLQEQNNSCQSLFFFPN